jgi:hypothetical protein
MADFYPAAQQLQNPDILGAYIKGQMAPLQLQAAQQQVEGGQLDIQKLRMALQQQGQVMDYAGQLAGQATGAQNSGGPTGGLQNGPQGQVSSQPPAQGNQGGYGSNVNTMMALDVLQGRDPLKTAESAQAYEQKQRQLQAQGPLSLFDTVAGSPSPARIVMNNPTLMQGWQRVAPQLGMDPVKDFSDDNVRQALNFARNQIAGGAGLPTTAPPVQEKTINGPLGSIYQQNPISQKITQVKAEEPLKDVIDPATGQPTNMRASQAEGKQPFNQSIFGASNITDQQKDLAYQTYVTTGGKLPAGMMPRSDAAKAQIMDYIAQRAKADGNTAVSIAAQGQATQATQGVLKDFTSGATSKSLNAINTAVSHINSLEPLVDALGSGDIKRVNQFSNAFKQETGSPAPTDYASIKEFVGGEIAKAVLPGGGGEKERAALLDPLSASNSPAAIKSALEKIQIALAGKTEATRNQWDVGTRGTQGSFDKFLMPATKKALGIADTAAPEGGAHPPAITSLLDKYK